ncbi:MAG: PAS domain S-box protein [Spirochaetaceae bacterium]|nr:MAG: PAS domain S-box protein [Spirochaetaceae bacterium]
MAKAAHDRQEIMQLLDSLVNGSYRELSPERYPDHEEREIVRLVNMLYRQRQQIQQSWSESLQRSEKRLREVIETTPVGICITNADGIFEYVNPPYCRLYQYRPEELLGKHFTLVVPESERGRLSELHGEFMGRRWELRGEWTVQRKDGSQLSILADAAYIIDIDERPKKVTFVVDITDRKRAEQQLHETVARLHNEIEERKRIEKIKREVERIIQHDLRNPLNGILTATELLLRDDLTESQKELALLIRDSGRKLNTMINSSMDIVRMEEGSYELALQDLNLFDILSDCRAETIGLARKYDVALIFEVDGRAIDWNAQFSVHGEEIYLEDLLVNLIRNAVEASKPGDQVRISVTTGDPYRIDIHNPAVVPAEIRGSFFERYSTFGKPNGNGLGTYIARLIARVHGGDVDFTTNETEGTHLTVTLPRSQI